MVKMLYRILKTCRADARNAAGGREEGEGRNDHFVPRRDVGRHQRQKQRVASGSAPDREVRSGIFRDVFFELSHFRPENEHSAFVDAQERGVHRVAQFGVLTFQIQQRNGGDGSGHEQTFHCKSTQKTARFSDAARRADRRAKFAFFAETRRKPETILKAVGE